MNTIFFHDTIFVNSNGKYYTCGTMNKEKFDEYKKYFGNITAVVRVIDKNNKNKSSIIEKNLVENVKIINVSPNYTNVIKVVREQIKKTDFAIIRMHSIIGIIACREARKYNIPYMIEMVACPQDALWYHGGIKYKIMMPIIVLLTKHELKKSKNTIYVTQRFLQDRYPTKGNYISCSDVKIQSTSNENILKDRINKINKLNKNSIIKFGIIGSLNVNFKGHKTAIKSLSKLNTSTNFELHFLGSGNKERWIKLAEKYKIKNRLFFDGVLPHDEVYNWLDNIDIFLIPSLQEGLPRALVEAMSRACPCIGSKVGGIPELLKNEYLIKKNKYKDLYTIIEKMLKDKDIMKEMAIENYQKSLNYQEKILRKKTKDFYKRIVSN